MNVAANLPDDGLNDDELLAAQHISSAAEDDQGERDDFAGEWKFDQGFPDSKRSVRVWVDEDTRRVTKIRVSPRWREILGSRTLTDAFGEAFFLANARVADDASPEMAVTQFEGDPTLGWADLADVRERITALTEAADELGQRAPEDVRWADLRGVSAVGTAAGGAVTVTLALTGLTQSVSVDKKWAAEARMADITDAVMRAHHAAYARFEPPVYVPGEHEELADQLAQAREDLKSIMSKELV